MAMVVTRKQCGRLEQYRWLHGGLVHERVLMGEICELLPNLIRRSTQNLTQDSMLEYLGVPVLPLRDLFKKESSASTERKKDSGAGNAEEWR